MKIIGLDVGTRRIGVAKADTSVRIAVPDGVILVTGKEFEEIARLANRYNTNLFVLGLPRNSQGLETAQSAYVRDFAKKLKRVIPAAKIKFQDESLTSVEAEQRLSHRRKGYQKGDIDTEAAVIILQDFIEHFRANQPSPSSNQEYDEDQNSPDQENEELLDLKSIDKEAMTKHKNKKIRKRLIKILTVIIFVVGIGGFLAYGWYNLSLNAIYQIPSCSGEDERCKEIDFEVVAGEPMSQIADNLQNSGLIKSSLAFQLYMKFHYKADGSSDFKIGQYKIRRTMSVAEIVEQLIKGAPNNNVFQLTILPGETVYEIKQKLITKYGYSQEEVDAAFAKEYTHPILKDKPDTSNFGAEPLEGYIFGDTYEFYIGESVEKIINTTLDRLQEVVTENDLESQLAEHGYTLAKGIILASIVQKEAYPADQPMVAQVFYNRLATGMTLGSDVTTTYALDLVDRERTVYQDNASALSINSLYNTRLYGGLTPGAICNPGLSALLAVANPTPTDALYFLTGDDGVMYYSNTDEEHQANIREHCQILCNVGL